MKKQGFALALALTLLVSCAPAGGVAVPSPSPLPAPAAASTPTPAPVEPLDFSAFQRTVNEERRAAITDPMPLDLSAWMEDFPDQLDAFTEEEMTLLLTERAPVRSVTLDEALEDVETCFLLLKTTYGAYEYFGGDEVFLPLLEQARAGVAAADEKRVLNAGALEEVLVSVLAPVLLDGHFSIGTTNLITLHRQEMYYVPDLYFADTAGLDPAYVKPTVAPDGSIQYTLAAVSHDGTDLPAAVGPYSDLNWTRADRLPRADFAFREQETDGIPVLVSRRMFAGNPEEKEQLARFAACGGAFRGLPFFVLDVRANPGGSDDTIMEWFEGWAGHPAQPRRAWGHRLSRLACRVMPNYYPASRMGQWRSYAADGLWTETESTVFVLTDGGTASSGETAVEFMRSVDQAVFVGAPSGGCALVPNNVHFYLPHSALELYFGTGLTFCETMENRDGVGYLPDLWVNPPDALDAVVRLRDYYGLPGLGEYSFEGTVFQYGQKEYDLSQRRGAVNAILSCTPAGRHIVVAGHTGPKNAVYFIFDTQTQEFVREIDGANLIWYDDDITTGVYSLWSELCNYDGEVIAACELGPLESIRELAFRNDHTQVEVTIASDTDIEDSRTVTYGLPG